MKPYSGARTVEAFDKFIDKLSGNEAPPPPGATEITQKDGLYKLTDHNVKAAKADKEHIYFVKHFAPWCGHCKNMAPAWEALAKANQNGKVRIAEIDCTTDAEACSDAGVRGSV